MGSLGARGVGACNDRLRRDAARCNKTGHRNVGRELKAKGALASDSQRASKTLVAAVIFWPPVALAS
jgi:hypothetical protein